MIPEMNPITAAALDYARRGWAIIPLKGKRPIPKNWPEQATTDERKILAWLEQYPKANIGLVTGARSGFFVLDVDGVEGEQSLRQLELQHGELPATLEGRTGGGGRHILFRMPDCIDLGNANGALKRAGYTKLDIRGTGGQIVAPPSIHPDTGAVYEWAASPETTAIADAPAWLVELLTQEEVEERPRPVASVINIDDSRARKYGIGALDSEGRELAETTEGGRNDRLNKAAMKMGGLSAVCGISEAMAEAVLVDAAIKAGLTRKEALATFRSGWKAGVKKPRALPESQNPGPGRSPKASAVPVPPADDFEELVDDYEQRLEEEDEGQADEDLGHGDGSGGGSRPLPKITIEGGALDFIVTQAEAALMAAGIPIYQRGTVLVRPIGVAVSTIRGIKRQGKALVIQTVEEAWLVEAFTKAAHWQKYDGRKDDFRRIDCPAVIARTYMARTGSWHVPPLRGIIEAPTLRPDGTILETPGYDEATGLVFEPGRTKFEPIPQEPTRDDAIAALAKVREVIAGFPFVAAHDESIAIAAILTGLVRRSLTSAPMTAFSARKMGTGKSLLADVVGLFATGRPVPKMAPATNPEEESKRLFAALIEGDPILCIDNIEAPLSSDTLCTILTQEELPGRILGSTKTVKAPTCATWLATGNNLQFVGDLTTRVVRCDLDAQMERPEERAFNVDLIEYLPERRAELVPAALTVLRAYEVAGRPKQDIPQFGRFEGWSDWIRSALVWAGMADPCLSRHNVEASDSVRMHLVSVLSSWYEAFGSERRTLQQVIKFAKSTDQEEFNMSLLEVAATGENVNPRRLGKWLKKFEGRIEGGFKIEQDGIVSGNVVWKVVKAGGGFVGFGDSNSYSHEEIADKGNANIHEDREVNPPNPTNPPGPLFDQGEDLEEGDA